MADAYSTVVDGIATAAERWKLDFYSGDHPVGVAASAIFAQSANRLHPDLSLDLDAGASQVHQLLDQYRNPVLAWAQKAKYDPKLDDGWLASMFSQNTRQSIVNGTVNFAKYMGQRYSPAMVNMVREWSLSRVKMPEVVGYKPRQVYDERRRQYYDADVPLYTQDGKGPTTPDTHHGAFLNPREIIARVDLEHAKLDRNTPMLVIFSRDMERQAKQAAFQPLEWVDGHLVPKKNGFYERLYHSWTNPEHTANERDAARTTMDLISGRMNFANPLNRMMAAHTDAVLTQNLGSAFANYIGVATLPNVSPKALLEAHALITQDLATKKLLQEAGLVNTITYQRQLTDPNRLHFDDHAKDLYRQSEEHVRALTYVAAAKDYAAKHNIPWGEVLAGKTQAAHLARGYGLQEVRNTQGNAHMYSVRAGKVWNPANFYLKSAKLSEVGRTAAQAKLGVTTGNWKPFMTNIGIRLALGGGRMVVSPTTAAALAMAVQKAPGIPQDQKDQALLTLSAVRNGTQEVDLSFLGFQSPVQPPLQVLDNMAGTNWSQRNSLVDVNSIPGAALLSGKSEPVDLSPVMGQLGNQFDSGRSSEEKLEDLLKAGQTISAFLPKTQVGNTTIGSTFTAGGVKVSLPLLLKVAQLYQHHNIAASGQSVPYNGTSVRVQPVAEASSVFAGGFGPSGQIEKERILNQGLDKQQLISMAENDMIQYKHITPATQGMMEQYLKVHGAQEFKDVPRDQWAARLEKEVKGKHTQPVERELYEHARTVIESKMNHLPDYNQRLAALKQKVAQMKQQEPKRYGHLTVDYVLGEALKRSRR